MATTTTTKKKAAPRLAISIRQPWASRIIFGTKRIEYRSWATDIRGPVWIHAGTAPDAAADARAAQFGITLKRGGIIGVASIVNVEWSPKHNCYAWHLADVRPVRFRPCKGKLKFFDPGA